MSMHDKFAVWGFAFMSGTLGILFLALAYSAVTGKAVVARPCSCCAPATQVEAR